MRPLQILLNNLLYDFSELPIPADRVDDADLLAPRRWNAARVRNFMLCFGPLSSVFDLLGFAALLHVFHTPAAMFQSAWFVQSMATQVLVIFVVRTARAPWRDRPSGWLVFASVGIVAIAFALPFLPIGRFFGFVPVPADVLGFVAGLTVVYLLVTAVAKRAFDRFSGASGPATAGSARPASLQSAAVGRGLVSRAEGCAARFEPWSRAIASGPVRGAPYVELIGRKFRCRRGVDVCLDL